MVFIELFIILFKLLSRLFLDEVCVVMSLVVLGKVFRICCIFFVGVFFFKNFRMMFSLFLVIFLFMLVFVMMWLISFFMFKIFGVNGWFL